MTQLLWLLLVLLATTATLWVTKHDPFHTGSADTHQQRSLLGLCQRLPLRFSSPHQHHNPNLIRHILDVNGQEREFLEYNTNTTPETTTAVFLLHGMGQNMWTPVAEEPTSSQWLAQSESAGYMLLSPNGINQRWNDGRPEGPVHKAADDVAFLQALADWAVAERNIATLYIVGFSNGGMMAYTMALERPGLFAAVVTVCSNLPAPAPTVAVISPPTPVLMLHATNDPIMKPAGGLLFNNAKEGRVLSVKETIDFWLTVNGVDGDTVVTNLPSASASKCTLIRTEYFRSTDSTTTTTTTTPTLVHYSAVGGGHFYPKMGHKINLFVRLWRGPACGAANSVDLIGEFLQQRAP